MYSYQIEFLMDNFEVVRRVYNRVASYSDLIKQLDAMEDVVIWSVVKMTDEYGNVLFD